MTKLAKTNLNHSLKGFCDEVIHAYEKEVSSFAIKPRIVKNVSFWMNEQAENYKKQFEGIYLTIPGNK